MSAPPAAASLAVLTRRKFTKSKANCRQWRWSEHNEKCNWTESDERKLQLHDSVRRREDFISSRLVASGDWMVFTDNKVLETHMQNASIIPKLNAMLIERLWLPSVVAKQNETVNTWIRNKLLHNLLTEYCIWRTSYRAVSWSRCNA